MQNNFRVATWNTKQGVAPRQPESALWDWIQKTITPDVIVLTEAKAPKTGFPKTQVQSEYPNWGARVWVGAQVDPLALFVDVVS